MTALLGDLPFLVCELQKVSYSLNMASYHATRSHLTHMYDTFFASHLIENVYTVVQEIFACKIFRLLIFHVV